jgi:glycosyltransferase involved in cell wall biosynthesis
MEKIFVISPVYNAQNYIEEHIKSVHTQVVPKGYEVYHIVVDDGSSDETTNKLKDCMDKLDYNLYVISNNINRGALYSHLDGLNKAKELGASKNSIIVQLDGDDKFCSNKSLIEIARAYVDPTCYATYGNYKTKSGAPSVCRANFTGFRESIVNGGWCFSHPRTFLFKLFFYVNSSSFIDEESKFYTSAPDVALFLPILELAGVNRVRFINKVLVEYNDQNPLNEDKAKLQDQIRCALSIYRKEPYSEL